MSRIKKEWHGPRRREELAAGLRRNLSAAALIVAGHAKRLLSVAGTGQGRDARGKPRRAYGANPSRPGEPPHKQTGRLRASVAWEIVDRLLGGSIAARVGTNVKYGRWLELGTRKMAARPWLRRAVNEKRDAVVAAVSKPLN